MRALAENRLQGKAKLTLKISNIFRRAMKKFISNKTNRDLLGH